MKDNGAITLVCVLGNSCGKGWRKAQGRVDATRESRRGVVDAEGMGSVGTPLSVHDSLDHAEH